MGNRTSSQAQRVYKDAEALLPSPHRVALVYRFRSLAQANTLAFKDFSRFLGIGDDLARFLFLSVVSFSPPSRKYTVPEPIVYEALLLFVARYAAVAIPPQLRSSACNVSDHTYSIFALFAKSSATADSQKAQTSTSLHPSSPSSSSKHNLSASASPPIVAKGVESACLTIDDVFQLMYGMASLAISNLRDSNGIGSGNGGAHSMADDQSTVLSSALSDNASKWQHDIEISPTRMEHSVVGTSLKPIHSADASYDNISTRSSEISGWRANSIKSTTAVFNMKIDTEDAVSHFSLRPDMASLKSTLPNRRGNRPRLDKKFIRQLVYAICRQQQSRKTINFQQLQKYLQHNMPFLFDISLHTFLHNRFLTLSKEEAKDAQASANVTPTSLHPILLLATNSSLDLEHMFLLSTFIPAPRPFRLQHVQLHLLYKSLAYGTSITKLAHQVVKYPGDSILLLTLALENESIIVGAYISSPWSLSAPFGSIDTRLFVLSPTYFQVLSPTKLTDAQPDKYIQFSSNQGIQFGGSIFRRQHNRSSNTMVTSSIVPPSSMSASLSIAPTLQHATLQLSPFTSPFPSFRLDATQEDHGDASQSTLNFHGGPELTLTLPLLTGTTRTIPSTGQVTLPILDMEILGIDKDGMAMTRLLREQEFERRDVNRRAEVNIKDRAVESVLLSMAGREMLGENERALKLNTDDGGDSVII